MLSNSQPPPLGDSTSPDFAYAIEDYLPRATPATVSQGANAVNAPQAVEVEHRWVPDFDDADRGTRKNFHGDEFPFPAVVKQKVLNYMLARYPKAYRAWEVEVEAVFNPGYQWLTYDDQGKTDTPAALTLKTAIEAFITQINADPVIIQGYSLKYNYGFVPFALTRKETFDENPEVALKELAGPADPKADILKMNAIEGDRIVGIDLGKKPFRKDFGEITRYWMLMDIKGDPKTKVEVHASRFIHWKNQWIDNDPRGIQRLHPAFDDLLMSKYIDHAAGETPRQFARPLPVMKPLVKVSKKEHKAVNAMNRGYSNLSYVTLPPDWDMELLSTSGALDIDKYSDINNLNIATATTGSEFDLFGARQGTLSTSTTNQKRGHTRMGFKQKNDVSPIYYCLIELGRLTGQIPMGGTYEQKWGAQLELDEVEQTKVDKIKAETNNLKSQTILNLTGIGWTAEAMEDDIKFTSPEGATIVMKGMAGTAPELKARAVNAQAPFLDTETKRRLYDEASIKTAELENEMIDKTQSFMTGFNKQFLTFMATEWEKEIGPIDFDPNATTAGEMPKGIDTIGRKVVMGANGLFKMEFDRIYYNVNSQGEFQTQVNEFEPLGFPAFEQSIIDDGVEAWRVSTGQTAAAADVPVDPDALIDEEILSQITADGKKLAQDLWGNQHAAVTTEISKGLKAGDGYKEISDAVSQEVFAGTKKLPTTVRTYIQTQASEAQFKAQRAAGATKWVFLTSNDALVRPEHAAAEGQIGDEKDFMPLLSDYNCRCTIIPRTIWDEIVEEEAAEASL